MELETELLDDKGVTKSRASEASPKDFTLDEWD